MGSKMLIDAAHPEETRVVVVRGKRIEEFDYESAQRKQLKGNIYLAKVTRVEPSLQAAFVEYGGNRHGFLAFNEIHPDYYQIPIADREALLAEEREEARANDDLDDDEAEASAEPGDAEGDDGDNGEDDSGIEAITETGESATVDTVGDEDAMEELPKPRRQRRRSYKIQEVIKRRQIILVQVVKEERGNKGAALTTYLSLAGRYCVLMPNTARGGGISRKITDAKDRKRLKEVAREVEVPEGMGLIVRTAGAQRTKAEIKRDYDYLLRLWENVRDHTLESTAPCLVYEEGNLIKRSIRDLYGKDVDEVLVEGDDAHKEAKAFMKMLMPSHARHVKLYKDSKPLFARHQVDQQLDGLFSPVVTLQSGGYLVINQTEALVSIDINSGKATREHNIEDTAVKTNLEAANEIARQLRLRDLAGLIVIDFIDMEEKRNNRAVERRLKEALKNDRARIQVGRISHFGLLEMSRQRLRQGMLEGSTKPCPHCEGTGLIRSIASCALSVLRAIDDQLMTKKAENLTVKCNHDVAFYILNEKRDHILNQENVYGISIFILPDDVLGRSEVTIERGAERAVTRAKAQPVSMTSAVEIEEEVAEEEETETTHETVEPSSEGEGRRRRRRRGRRGGRRSRERDEAQQAEAGSDETADDGDDAAPVETAADGSSDSDEAEAQTQAADEETDETPRKRRRRSRRKPAAEAGDEAVVEATSESEESEQPAAAEAPAQAAEAESEAEVADMKPARKPRKSRAKKKTDEAETSAAAEPEAKADTEAEATAEAGAEPEKPKRKPRTRRKAAASDEAAAEEPKQAEPAGANGEAQAPAPEAAPADKPDNAEESMPAPTWTPPKQTAEASGPPKTGWWRRR